MGDNTRFEIPKMVMPLRALAVLVLGAIALNLACTPTGPGVSSGDVPATDCDRPGVICTVVGTGESLFNGDGQDALSTALYTPLDIEFDAEGRPLILDSNNLRVRRLNADNTIETIIGLDFEELPENGALGVDTPLHHASDMEFDGLGRMFLAGNHAPIVFRMDTDQRVYWVAGNGDFENAGDGGPALEARFMAPYGVVPDNLDGLFVSDYEAHVVRYIDPSGIISTVAGDGTPGYSGDGGPGPQAKLNRPTHLRLDDQGRLLICDTGNHAIRRLEADGTIQTIAGTGVEGYSGDDGPAAAAQLSSPTDARFAPDGTLHIADRGNNVIRRIDNQGAITTVVGAGERGFGGDGETADRCLLNRASGLNFAPDGSLWIADTYNQRVRRIAGYSTATNP